MIDLETAYQGVIDKRKIILYNEFYQERGELLNVNLSLYLSERRKYIEKQMNTLTKLDWEKKETEKERKRFEESKKTSTKKLPPQKKSLISRIFKRKRENAMDRKT